MPILITLAALKRLQPATQAELVQATGLDQKTVSRDLDQLHVAVSERRNVHGRRVKQYEVDLPARKLKELHGQD